MSFGAITEPYWSDKKVFLIGGGASLSGVRFDYFNKIGLTVGVNEAAFKAKAKVCFSLDSLWIRNSYERLLDFKGQVVLAVADCFPIPPKIPKHIIFLRKFRQDGLSSSPEFIFGLNSGYGALNLAYLKRAQQVYLLGYDMYRTHKNNHWHGGYSWFDAGDTQRYPTWAEQFNTTIRQLYDSGTRVINTNPKSIINCFPKEELCQLFPKARFGETSPNT